MLYLFDPNFMYKHRFWITIELIDSYTRDVGLLFSLMFISSLTVIDDRLRPNWDQIAVTVYFFSRCRK